MELDAPLLVRDGTHRAATLAQTWQRAAPLMKHAQITRLADVTGLDTLGIPVVSAIRPLGKSLSTQQGKGITLEHARVSALMESLETWTAENLTLELTRTSAKRLGPQAVDVRKLPRPRGRLDRDAIWKWVAGRDLLSDRVVYVPEQAVTLDTTFTRAPLFDISSNGLASGNVIGEAIAHGIAEVIERDTEAAWRRSGGDRRIVIESIPDPVCRALIDRVVATGARIWLWNMDGIIPVVGCAIMEDPNEPGWRSLGFYQGFGAHTDATIAITRAITEAAQTRLTYIAGARDDFFPFDYERATDPEILAEVWQQLSAPCDEPALFDDLAMPATQTIGEDVAAMLDALVADGATQVIAVDLTHPTLGIPVVKIVIPGRATDVEAMG